jgi:hypothetical protein
MRLARKILAYLFAFSLLLMTFLSIVIDCENLVLNIIFVLISITYFSFEIYVRFIKKMSSKSRTNG